MQDVFGVITPTVIIATVVVLIQIAKDHFGWDDKQTRVAALVISAVPTTAYHLLTGLPEVFKMTDTDAVIALGWLIFEALFYSLLVWLAATGAYHIGIKPSVDRAAQKKDDGFPK